MCYDDNARPPMPPGTAGAAKGEDIVLSAADGNRFAAYSAAPEHPTAAQILIFPDVRGLHQFYKELAMRFAEVGISPLAIDYFGRSAGLTARDNSFEYWPHVQQMKPDTFFADVEAALAQLRTGEGATRSTFTVGFCMGGTQSFLNGTRALNLAGVIGFYARLTRVLPGMAGNVISLAGQIKAPVLGLFGSADQGISASDVQAFEQQLSEAGIEHKIISYPGAPHSFFDRRSAEFAAASADAWKQVLSFISAHSPKV